MGEEKKAKEKKPAEEKKPEVEKKAKKKEKVDKKPATDEKPKEDPEKKSDDGGGGGGDAEKKDSKDEQPPPQPSPPPPPPEIVLKVFMHCEGCARKVRRCLKGFDGVEEVTTDCKTHKVVVKGEKADPLKVLDRLQKKTHRQVELLSPIPKPPAEEAKKPEEQESPKPPEIKEEPKVITVVLKVHMHCEACSLEIKRRIERMKEVEEAIPDLKNSQVTVKGVFDPPKLVEYVYKRTGRHATLVNQDPPPPPPEEKKEDDKGKDIKEEKKEPNSDEEKKKVEEPKEEAAAKVDDQKPEPESGAKAKDEKAAVAEDGPATAEEGAKMVELKTNEFQYYPPRYAMEMQAYPPQMFSDENPNACSIM
ncbi:hypothetical protein RND81_02G048400 [Saponaria officinalis]|uniref:HMA domain-containing protein n=1 Tax=Saponaria officinalis TaxID=3572 RepID=A0AAW1MRV8_SAPOF